jgi:DNA-binding GntR family transcriptional regulator
MNMVVARDGKTTKQSASSRVYDFVRGQIVGGGYPAGELITEMEVAKALGVSRTPVREAFKVLGNEAWLRVFPKRGALVVPVTYAEVADVFELRRILEPWVTERVVSQPISPELRRNLLAAVKGQRASLRGNLVAFRAAGQRIHELLVEATGNALLADVYRNIQGRQLRMGPSPVEPAPVAGWRERLVEEHEQLVAAILAGDRETAIRLAGEHVANQAGVERGPRNM